MNDLNQVITTLTAAREWLVKNGWAQGAYFRDKSGLGTNKRYEACSACTVGAIGAACDISTAFMFAQCSREAIKAVAEQLQKDGIYPPHDDYWADDLVIKWNDKVATSKEEVIALFDRTIERLNAQRVDVV